MNNHQSPSPQITPPRRVIQYPDFSPHNGVLLLINRHHDKSTPLKPRPRIRTHNQFIKAPTLKSSRQHTHQIPKQIFGQGPWYDMPTPQDFRIKPLTNGTAAGFPRLRYAKPGRAR